MSLFYYLTDLLQMLSNASVLQNEIIRPLSFGLGSTIVLLTVIFLFLSAIFNNIQFFTATSAVKNKVNTQTTVHSCTPGN